ncbi:MAG: DUF4386 domain-containing protein [Gemmatimonadetes bacterium]|nr:MAG: DUF4386 domain-containing protein [Gemmatimonadota bacterium]
MTASIDELRRKARYAGFLYLLMGITAPIGLLYVPGKLIVSGNATATADNIRAAPSLLGIGIASELFHQVVNVFLVLALFRLFAEVNKRQATLMVVLGVLGVPVVMLNVLNEIAPLALVSGQNFLSVFDKSQQDALAYLFIRLHGRGLDVASIFWGLWLFPFAMLVIESGFIPRILGYLMMLAGFGYLLNVATVILAPQYAHLVGDITMILGVGELPIMFWLLIWGARWQSSQPAVA